MVQVVSRCRIGVTAASLAAFSMAVVTGCGGRATFVNVEDHGKIAVVSYALDKSIVKKGEEKDNGPGLLQRDESYYADHRKAVNALWEQFKQNVGPAFLNAQFVDFAQVAANPKYQELTKHVPKMMLGKDIAPGASELTPEGINYVSEYDKAKLEVLAKELGAGLLLLVKNQASYDLFTGVNVAILGSNGAAKMSLRTEIDIYEPGKGVVASHSFTNESSENVPMLAGNISTKEFETSLPSAQMKTFEDIKTFVAHQRDKAKEQQSQAK